MFKKKDMEEKFKRTTDPEFEVNVTNELLPSDINLLNYVLDNWGNSGLTHLDLHEKANQ